MMNDDGFLAAVYRTSVVLWVIGAVVLVALRCWGGLIGWTVGAAVSFGLVRSLELVVRNSFVPEASKSKQNLTRLSLVKLPIIVLVLAVLVLLGGRNFVLVGAFCAGVALVQTAIVLRTLRSLIAGRSG